MSRAGGPATPHSAASILRPCLQSHPCSQPRRWRALTYRSFTDRAAGEPGGERGPEPELRPLHRRGILHGHATVLLGEPELRAQVHRGSMRVGRARRDRQRPRQGGRRADDAAAHLQLAHARGAAARSDRPRTRWARPAAVRRTGRLARCDRPVGNAPPRCAGGIVRGPDVPERLHGRARQRVRVEVRGWERRFQLRRVGPARSGDRGRRPDQRARRRLRLDVRRRLRGLQLRLPDAGRQRLLGPP